MIPQHLSKSVEHFTPRLIVEPSRVVLGRIDLDPASCARANECVGAKKIFTAADDGLGQTWNGTVFVNPPGGVPVPRWAAEYRSRSSAVVWWRKLVHEFLVGNVERAIFVGFSLEILQAAQDDQKQWPDPLAFPFCVPSSRLRFDVEADAWAAALRQERQEASVKRAMAIDKKLVELEVKAGQIVSGDQPTHANAVVFVADDVYEFAKTFCSVGSVVVPS